MSSIITQQNRISNMRYNSQTKRHISNNNKKTDGHWAVFSLSWVHPFLSGCPQGSGKLLTSAIASTSAANCLRSKRTKSVWIHVGPIGVVGTYTTDERFRSVAAVALKWDSQLGQVFITLYTGDQVVKSFGCRSLSSSPSLSIADISNLYKTLSYFRSGHFIHNGDIRSGS